MGTAEDTAPAGDVHVEEHGDESILRIRANSNTQAVASALSHAVYDSRKVKLRAIGAGAVNQAVKSLAIARGYTATRGIDLSFRPGFETVTMPDKEEVSAIVFYVQVSG